MMGTKKKRSPGFLIIENPVASVVEVGTTQGDYDMNPKQRLELAERIAMRIDPEATPGFARHSRALSKAYDAISMVLEVEADRAATTTVAEPDAATVERVAKALWHSGANGMYPIWSEAENDKEWQAALRFYRSEGYDAQGSFPAFQLAKTAIAAMPSCADADAEWLDRALDSVHPRSWIAMLRPPYDDEDGWTARVVHPYESGDTPPESGHTWEGTGTTRREAILDAWAKAKEASNATD